MLVSTTQTGIGSNRPIVTRNFTTTDSATQIVAFYKERGDCGIGNTQNLNALGREMCRGNSNPFGEYFIYIDSNAYALRGLTSYALEIRWHGCSNKIE